MRCIEPVEMKISLLLPHFVKRGAVPHAIKSEEIFASVPHRQWLFTMPKRLRIYFRFDASPARTYKNNYLLHICQ